MSLKNLDYKISEIEQKETKVNIFQLFYKIILEISVNNYKLNVGGLTAIDLENGSLGVSKINNIFY